MSVSKRRARVTGSYRARHSLPCARAPVASSPLRTAWVTGGRLAEVSLSRRERAQRLRLPLGFSLSLFLPRHFFISRTRTHSTPHPCSPMGRKRDQPAAHRHGLAEDMANPWKNGVRVRGWWRARKKKNCAATAARVCFFFFFGGARTCARSLCRPHTAGHPMGRLADPVHADHGGVTIWDPLPCCTSSFLFLAVAG